MFIILLDLLMVTQVSMKVTHLTVRTRDLYMIGSKLIQFYGLVTFIVLLGLLVVNQVVM